MQYKKNPHPPNSKIEISEMHISTSLKGVKNAWGLISYWMSYSLLRETKHLLQHTASHITIVISIEAAESGNKKH